MQGKNRLLRLSLIICLVLGWAAYLPTASPHVALAENPLPPAEEVEHAAPVVLPVPPTPSPEEVELRAALAALEGARQQGPEAVLALGQTLRGKALDLAMGDIVAAHRQVALPAAPRPESPPINEAEELALLQAQAALDEAGRASALAHLAQPLEAQSPDAAPQAPTSPNAPNAPTADLTVGSAPCTYATITAAMLAANDGDRLLLEGGRVFTGSLGVHKSLTLQGGYAGCGSGSSDLTTINANGVGRALYIYDNLTVTLQNLNITNADSPAYGAGIFVYTNTHLIGTNLNIYSNTTIALGGGVFLWGARATFSETEIYSNTADVGAGVCGVLRGSYAPSLELASYADVNNNRALTGSGFGGGIYMDQGFITITDSSDIYNNHAIKGGGAYLISSTLTIRGEYSEIMHNTATGDGGGVWAMGSLINLDQDAEVYHNTAGTDGTGNGGGVYLDDSSLMSDKGLIYYNTADDYGGGVYATNDSLLDMDLGSSYPCAGPRCSQLSYNAAGLYGGGIYVRDSSEADLRQVFVEGNTGSYGGALYAYQSPVYLYNTLIARNDATAATGDALRLYTGSTLTGQHNTLAYNDLDGAATGDAVAMDGATLSLSNSIVWGHATSIPTGYTVTYSDIQGGYAGTGNLDVDPQFVNPGASDFHLQHSSPVIDRCATGQTRDFDNEPRAVTYIRPSTPYDMGADEASPRVGLNGAPCAYGRLQDAVDTAASGDTLQVASDTFTETVEIHGKHLTIVGGYDVDCTTFITDATTVNGAGAGSVFEVNNSAVTLRNLNITGGAATNGGGILADGSSQMTLDNTEVFRNEATYGGGLYINGAAVLTFTNDSDIHHNAATISGGGARVRGRLVGNDWASIISNNTAPNGGGVSAPGGVLELNGSHVSYNQATGATGVGGGIHVYDAGAASVIGSSNVHHNTAYNGAGIYAERARVNLQAVIHSNVAANDGGGVYLNTSALDANGTIIGDDLAGRGNQATAGAGGGIYAQNSAVEFDGVIYNNAAATHGGGIAALSGAITLTNAYVGGVGALQANRVTNEVFGAGLYVSDTHALLSNTVVASNTFASGAGWGAGIVAWGSSVLTLTDNSRVEYHYAPNVLLMGGGGAGILLYNSTATLSNSHVLSNTADLAGAGVYLVATSSLNVLSGSVIAYNRVITGNGGGIAATNMPDLHISDATLQHNTASANGGAIYLNAGALDFSGRWDVRWNHAGGNGGAVAVEGTGDADFAATTGESYLAVNTAGGNGGALYVNTSGTPQINLHATSGYPLNLNTNNAGGDGGAAYASGDALFDAYGQVLASSNIAGGNGGVFYLGNESGVYLDDYVNIAPQILVNQAQNGGAIYAQNSPRVQCDGAEFGAGANGNRATNGSGGAIYLGGSLLIADNCTFRNGQATQHGGAIAAYTSTLRIYATYPTLLLATERPAGPQPLGPQAIQSSTPCNPLTGECSSFYGNVANSDGDTVGDGGAIYSDNSALAVNHTILYNNHAYHGGAIYQTGAGATGTVANSMIYSNTIAHPLGAGIRRSGGAFTVTHTTLANNAGGAGFSGYVSAVSNTIAWGNTAGGFTVTPTLAACNIDQSGQAGISVNPLFVAPGAGEDYHLVGGSPAINACATGDALDLDNITRPVGAGYDMGAYEYAHGIAFAPDRASSAFSPGVVMYTHTLTNTGATPDTYTLSAQSGSGWSVSLDPAASVALPGGQSTLLTVSLTIPAGVVSGTLDTLVVTATSTGDPALAAAVTDTTHVSLRTYTLDVNTVGNGAVSVDPDQAVYLDGAVVTLTATADSGWYFGQWSGDASGALTTTTVLMDAHKVVTATFSPTPPTYYTLTMGIVGSGVVTPGVGAHYYLSGTVANLSASPATGWNFTGWTGDLESSANPATLVMDANKNVTANFSVDTFIITPTAGAGGQILPATPRSVAYGDDITFTVVPATGHHVADVGVDGVAQGALDSYTFNNVTADHTISATFALNEYTLTVDVVGDGAVARAPDQPTYQHGDVVMLTATPDAGWYFWQWTGDASGVLTQTTVLMDADKLVTATFGTIPPTYYTLTMSIVGSGVITPSVGAHSYLSGTVANLSASPATGWNFTGWTGDLESDANPAQILMDADKDVIATFTSISHVIYLPLVLRNHTN